MHHTTLGPERALLKLQHSPVGGYLGISPFVSSPRVSCQIYPSRGGKPQGRDISDTIPEGCPWRKGIMPLFKPNFVLNSTWHYINNIYVHFFHISLDYTICVTLLLCRLHRNPMQAKFAYGAMIPGRVCKWVHHNATPAYMQFHGIGPTAADM